MIMVMMTIEGMKVVIKLNITTSLEEITIYRKKRNVFYYPHHQDYCVAVVLFVTSFCLWILISK